jgi:hypothetical protein
VKTDRFPLAVLLAAAGLVAAVTFIVSAHGLWDLGQRVMGLPQNIAWCVPAGLDGAQLVAIAAVFITRGADWRIRVYLWTVSLITVGLSMAGNAWDSSVRSLTQAGIIATMVSPALLALTAHVIVVVWRATHPEVEPAAAPVVVRERQPSKPKPAKTGSRKPLPVADVARLRGEGLTVPQIATTLKISESGVHRARRLATASLNGDAA